MKKKLRLLSLVMAVFMLICCLPMNALADSFVVAGEEFEYYLNEEGTYTIEGYDGENEIVEIPSHIDGIAVTEIGHYGLYNDGDFVKLIIPETIEIIGNNALTCNGKLMDVEVHEDNPYFCDVDGVLYNKEVTTIVYYPEGREDKTYTLPETVTELGEYCFHYTNIETLSLPKKLKKINNRAFYGASKLKEVVLPTGLESIGSGAFYYCENLTEIAIPDSVVSLGDYCFSSCYNLKNVHLGSGLNELGDSALGSGNSLRQISVASDNKAFVAENDVLFNKDKTVLIKYPSYKTDTDYTLPSTVKTIKSDSFNQVEYLEKIELPDTLECIEDEAFGGLKALKYVNIPDSVTYFGYNFMHCESLERAYIGKSVEFVELYSTFGDCHSLKSIEVSADNPNYSSKDGVLFNKDKTELVIFPAGLSMDSYTIPRSVREIGSYVFASQEKYNEILYEEGAVYVDDCLIEWENIDSKGNICVKPGTRIIANGAFWAESSIWGISLPDETEIICSGAFHVCDILQALYIPAGVKYIGNDIFWANNMVYDIYYGGTEAQWNRIENIENAGIPEYATIHFESEGNEYVNPVLPEDMYDNTYVDSDSGVSVSTDTDADLSVEDVKTQEVVDSVAELLPKAKVESVYEINLQRDGEEVQPDDRVLVKIPAKNRFARVYRMEEDGTLTDMNAKYDGGYLWFYTDHFSYYALGTKQAELYELGDVDMNEVINVKDATAIQKHLASIQEYQPDVIDLLMDVDSDTNVNIKDATMIQKMVAGLI